MTSAMNVSFDWIMPDRLVLDDTNSFVAADVNPKQ